MGKTTTLTRHAISPPAFERTKVHRERLVDTIHANLPRKLIAVIAPAGYGKTTLLSDFATHTELPVCWLRLTEADRDVMRMAGVLQASLVSRFRRLQRSLRVDAMANADESAVAAAFARVIGSAVAEPFVLIVDDVHLVNPSPSVMGFWSKFIEVQPENMTLIMAGREVPNLPLDDLLEKNKVAGIGPLELSLTTAELAELCQKALGRALDEAEAERLQKETGGWVMGVLLSGALPVAGLGVLVQSPRPMVYDYLAAVVLNRQSPGLRKFLLHSSVLPVMTAEACDQVLRRRDSGRVLSQALRNGLFLSSTGERPKTYEYHPQFREFLQATLREEDHGQVSSRLSTRAGDFLARKLAVEQGIDLYLAAGLRSKAARLISSHAREIRHQGRSETLARWRSSFGEHDRAWGELTLEIGIALADKGMVHDAEEMLNQASKCARTVHSKVLHVRSLSALAQVAFTVGAYAKARSRAKRAVSFSRGMRGLVRADAIRYLAISESAIRPRDPKSLKLLEQAVRISIGTGDKYATTVFSIDLAETADRLGLWERTIEETRRLEGAVDVDALRGLRPQLLVYLCIADLYEGKLEAAFERTIAAEYAALESASMHMFIQSMCLRAQVLGLLGQTDEALACLDRGLRHTISVQVPTLAATLLDMRMDVLRWRGRLNEAKDAARAMAALDLPPDLKHWGAAQRGIIEASGNDEALVASLGQVLPGAGMGVRAGEMTCGHWFLSKAKHSLGDSDGHSQSLAIALDAGKSPMNALWLAAELSFDSEYSELLLERHGEDEIVRRITRLATAFRNARRNKEGPNLRGQASSLAVLAFGPRASVRKDGKEISLRPLDRALLILLLEGKTSRSHLEETLWPGGSSDNQRANLHSAIYRLRCAIGHRTIRTEGGGYAIANVLSIEYDVREFQQTCGSVGRQSEQGLAPGELARRAIEIYKGGFLSSSNASWACRRRAELEDEFLTLCGKLAEVHISAGRLGEAEILLGRAMELNGCSDNLVERALEVIALQGKWGTLSRIYEEYSDRLREELGLDPSIEVRKKYEAVLNGTFQTNQAARLAQMRTAVSEDLPRGSNPS